MRWATLCFLATLLRFPVLGTINALRNPKILTAEKPIKAHENTNTLEEGVAKKIGHSISGVTETINANANHSARYIGCKLKLLDENECQDFTTVKVLRCHPAQIIDNPQPLEEILEKPSKTFIQNVKEKILGKKLTQNEIPDNKPISQKIHPTPTLKSQTQDLICEEVQVQKKKPTDDIDTEKVLTTISEEALADLTDEELGNLCRLRKNIQTEEKNINNKKLQIACKRLEKPINPSVAPKNVPIPIPGTAVADTSTPTTNQTIGTCNYHQETIFLEDWNDAAKNGWGVTLESGLPRLTLTQPATPVEPKYLSLKKLKCLDATYRSAIHLQQGSTAGLTFRVVDDENMMVLLLDAAIGTVSLRQHVNGIPKLIDEKLFYLVAPQFLNQLAIIDKAQEGTIQVLLGNKTVLNVKGYPSYRPGSFGPIVVQGGALFSSFSASSND